MIMLRALEIGLKLSDLDDITLGELIDILIEHDNDSYDWPVKATQDDFRSF